MPSSPSPSRVPGKYKRLPNAPTSYDDVAGAMSDRDDFLARVAEAIRGGGLFEEGDPVLAAVSGGADSVAMAWALREGGLCRLHLAHVHHGLRPQADGDAEFVADLARRWSVPVHVERIDTPALAEQWGCGIEEAARRGRYDALAAMAESAGASAVAVAHHAGDQAETVLHRIVRGTHLRGLAGMPPRRPLTATVALVRPLLWATRERIEAVLSAEGLTWRTDHTNRQMEFTRNFLRHEARSWCGCPGPRSAGAAPNTPTDTPRSSPSSSSGWG